MTKFSKLSKDVICYMLDCDLDIETVEQIYNIGLKGNFVLQKLKNQCGGNYSILTPWLFRDMIEMYCDWLEIPEYNKMYW